ncbi:MAG: multicopper oxidase domain-containing protein [Thermoanaerobaculia bacterium]|nr:multicopper oxidase domain-containing protein [Thermoanaerobaculia bacterium]
MNYPTRWARQKIELTSVTLLMCLFASESAQSTSESASTTVEYEITVAATEVDFTGVPVMAMTLNGGIPGPTLRFTEGDIARIQVHNEMNVATSIHWHGILVPNAMDGVPNLTFPPIAPHSTFIYEFPIRQSGTYWYHSHTGLQEQRGVYGPIVISPRGGEPDPSDRDEVVMLSDWTNTDPHKIQRTLRRGSEWFSLLRGTGQSIVGAARVGKSKDYFSRELLRMPAMDIADVAYDLFLANGRPSSTLESRGGERVRVRWVNGSATTFFHLEFAGGPMTVVSADGIDVEPFEINRLLIAVAETYDVLIDVPVDGAWELRATSHDASGYASVWLGDGEEHTAPTVPYPNLYEGMGEVQAKRVFSLTPAGVMGMSGRRVDAGELDAPGMHMGDSSMDHGAMGADEGVEAGMDHAGMDHGDVSSGKMGGMDMAASDSESDSVDHNTMDHGAMDHGKNTSDRTDPGTVDHSTMDHSTMDHGSTAQAKTPKPTDHSSMDHSSMDPAPSMVADRSARADQSSNYSKSFDWMTTDLAARGELASDGMGRERPWPPYSRLKARSDTSFDPGRPVREIRLTLDGDMERYVWFLNGQPLSKEDDIRIRQDEVVRFIMINRTMMHHPMHLHGHFFRVLNGAGDRSPLKHTVDVEPMSTTVIEFDANELGDWFFHCHLLYHMKSGMARVVSYEGFEPAPDTLAVRPNLYTETWYTWADASFMSHRTAGSLVSADNLNIVTADWELGWQDVDATEGEVTLTWDRYVNRFFTYFVGADIEGDEETTGDPRAVVGLRYLLPLSIESSLWVDSDGEFRLVLDKLLHFTPRVSLGLETEYDTRDDWKGEVSVAYLLNQRFDLLAQWHSENGLGAGLKVRF